MPTLIVENVPADVYECLRRRAAVSQRSMPEEMLNLLGQVLHDDLSPEPRLPELVPNEEYSALCDLPRSSQPVSIPAHCGQPRLPDQLPSGLGE